MDALVQIPRANWPEEMQVSLRVVQFVLGDPVRGEPYLLFEDPFEKNAFTHDEILGAMLEKLGIHYELELSNASQRRDYEIPARRGIGYSCPGMGYGQVVRDHAINFEGHSTHYALGINLAHLVHIAKIEKNWSICYNLMPLASFL